jgi:hypothetical protein
MAKESQQPYLDFDQYIRQGEPGRKERAQAWRTAIGLQAVDGLRTSEYLQKTAERNIEGDITIDQAGELIKSYYQPNLSTPTSSKYAINGNILRLVEKIGQRQLAVREMMEEIGLKDRENFLKYSLRPAIAEQFVQALYPDNPHHPRQKYLLTPKGRRLLAEDSDTAST